MFFDVTPIGKILNRFSKDLSVIDEQIFFDFDVFLEYLYLYFAALIVTAFSVPYTIIIIALFLIAGLCLFRYTIKAYKDCYRLSQVAMSPLLSFFQETFTGTSVIRAFKKDEEFKVKSFELIDRQAIANMMNMGVWCWYSIRLIYLTVALLATGCAVCILLRGEADTVLLSLMLQYLLTM